MCKECAFDFQRKMTPAPPLAMPLTASCDITRGMTAEQLDALTADLKAQKERRMCNKAFVDFDVAEALIAAARLVLKGEGAPEGALHKS